VAEGHLLAFERGAVGQGYILGGENILLKDILYNIASITDGKGPRFKIPTNAILPFAYIAEFWAKITGGKEPFASVDSLLMAKKKMYFSHKKASNELGYVPRPANQALVDAVQWFYNHNYIS
jgi:dihydroflavonol-4-reductase